MSRPFDCRGTAGGAGKPSLSIVRRYTLFQLPGIFLAASALLIARSWLGLPSWFLWAAFALWVLKDAVLFPLLWRSYVPGDGADTAGMVGLAATATGRISPSGKVLVRGEIWSATIPEGAAAVEKGETVTVRAVDGLTLLVEPRGGGKLPGEEAGPL